MRKINHRKGGVMEEMGSWEKLEEISACEKIRVCVDNGWENTCIIVLNLVRGEKCIGRHIQDCRKGT